LFTGRAYTIDVDANDAPRARVRRLHGKRLRGQPRAPGVTDVKNLAVAETQS
jgi:hypothetical protein